MKKYLSTLALTWVLFLPWIYGNNYSNSSSATIEFPEMKLTCVYGSCVLMPPPGTLGEERCIVYDSNSGRVVVNQVYFSCEEFMGKTIVWNGGGRLLTSTVIKVEKTY